MTKTDNKLHFLSNEVKNKRRLFFLTSITSLVCLMGSFGNPLSKLTVYQQPENGILGSVREDIYIITENTANYPYGFNPETAKPIAKIRKDSQFLKIFFLVVAAANAGFALVISGDVVREFELEDDVRKIERAAIAELLIKKIKFKAAIELQEQKLALQYELQGMAESYGHDMIEIQTDDAEEMLATDKKYEVVEMTQQGHSLEYSIANVYGLDQQSDEFKNVLRNFLEE